jgi:hypothetical protein
VLFPGVCYTSITIPFYVLYIHSHNMKEAISVAYKFQLSNLLTYLCKVLYEIFMLQKKVVERLSFESAPLKLLQIIYDVTITKYLKKNNT